MAHVEVDASRRLGDLPRPWTSFGYDELNWTYTPRGRRALRAFADFAERPFFVRAHNLLTSGRGWSWPHWGSGNVYHEDGAGNAVYDWTIVDQVFDAYVEVGFKPLVELGFTPRALVPPEAELAFSRGPSQYGPYEAGLWSFPPRDNARWQELVFRLAEHCIARYGRAEVGSWYWELWNEPDIAYWRGTAEEFGTLYDHTVAGLVRALPEIRVGGPAVTGGANAVRFMASFLAHCAGQGAQGINAVTGQRGTRLDFISLHTKGSAFGRQYLPLAGAGDGARFAWGGGDAVVEVPRRSPSRRKMLTEIRAHLEAAAAYPQFRHLPVLVDECDPCVPAHFNRYDNPNFGFRNTAYFASAMVSLFKRILDLNEALPDAPDVALATSWAFYFEGERYFEGFREFFTAENVELPLLNAYRLLARLGQTRLALASDATWDVAQVDELGAFDAQGSTGEPGAVSDVEVDGLAALRAGPDGDGTWVTLALWHHGDDQYAVAEPAEVEVTVHRLPFPAASAQVRHWRIDGAHSNAYAIWQALGQPQDPTPSELAQIKERQGLEPGPAVGVTPSGAEALRLRLTLPRHACSLLEIGPG